MSTNLPTPFARDVSDGLRQHPKRLPSKYFYDQQGDLLFQQIMDLPEYYLTGAEREIFGEQCGQILAALGSQPFDLIELGAGDGRKTMLLLRHFVQQGAAFRFCPIDISRHALDLLGESLAEAVPDLNYTPLCGDYLEALAQLPPAGPRRRVVLFPGANIGNYSRPEAGHFLQQLTQRLAPGDLLLIGFDLRKDPARILAAYNDPTGVTAAFNLNLLRRINRELDGNFDLSAFRHWETYNPVSGEARSYLVSLQAQSVRLGRLNLTIDFEAWEAIEVEVSRKYSPREIAGLAQSVGCQVTEQFVDRQGDFIDSLWERL